MYYNKLNRADINLKEDELQKRESGAFGSGLCFVTEKKSYFADDEIGAGSKKGMIVKNEKSIIYFADAFHADWYV